MALPSSGAISLNNVNVELGNSGTANINMGSSAVRDLFGVASGAIDMADGYGKSSFSAADHFNTTTYTGTGAELAINGVGFQPDFVWIKQRNIANSHASFDAIRGATIWLSSNGTGVEATQSQSLKSFDTDGFTVGTQDRVGTSGGSYVAWNWKANGSGVSNTSGSITSTVSANAPAGFSIVKYVSPNGNAGQTIGHGLSVAPEMVIFKKLNTTSNWGTWHKDLTGATYKLYLNTTGAQGTGGNPLISVPTSSLLNLSTSGNAVSGTFLSYAFHSVPGYSKVGSYTGNGSSTGTVVTTGFAPRYVMVKRVDSAGNWIVWDKVRDTTNTATRKLYPNLSNSEDTGGGGDIDLDSNGFQLRSTWGDLNGSGATYIYLAIA